MITVRDRQIIGFLQDRDFCLYKDITKKFFPSEVAACNRLKKLSDRGWITIEPIRYFYLSKNINPLPLQLMGDIKKIVRLNKKHRIIKRKPSLWRIEQQLILFSMKERLENMLGQTAIFKHEVTVKPTFYNGDYEPLPDFYVKGENYKLAVELDLHLRRNSLYHLKMSQYEGSSFTHILYVVSNIKKMNYFLRDFKYRRYIGIAHYSDVEEIMSYRYGKISLDKWLREDLNPRSPSPRF